LRVYVSLFLFDIGLEILYISFSSQYFKQQNPDQATMKKLGLLAVLYPDFFST